MLKIQTLLVCLGLAMSAVGCSESYVTVSEVQVQSFADNDELIGWLPCDGQWYSTTDGVIDDGLHPDPGEIVAAAREQSGTDVTGAVRVGEVWVLSDSEGRLVGGMAPGRDLVWCVRRGAPNR